jgi:FkbM family methyltransferase
LKHPVISYLHRSRSLDVANARTIAGVKERIADLFWGEQMLVTIPEEVSSFIYRYRYFEPELTGALVHYLKEGMVFLDLGAHYGYFSKLAALLVGAGGRVIAVEPIPATFRILEKNVAESSNVLTLNIAAFSGRTTLTMRDYGFRWSAFNSFTHARSGKVPADEFGSVSIETLTVDWIVRKYSVYPDFIKIDAESAEMEILKGAHGLLRDMRPALSLEVGDEIQIEGIPTSRELIEYVCAYGYSPYVFDGTNFAKHEIRSFYPYGNVFLLPDSNP